MKCQKTKLLAGLPHWWEMCIFTRHSPWRLCDSERAAGGSPTIYSVQLGTDRSLGFWYTVTHGRQGLNKNHCSDTTAVAEPEDGRERLLTGPADGQGPGDECNHEGDGDDGRGHEQ